MRTYQGKSWSTARTVLSVVMLIVALPIYLHSQDATTEVRPATVVNYFETDCQTAARQAYDVPPLTVDLSKGLVGWQHEHLDTPEGRAFNVALSKCAPAPKFDFANMNLVYSEVTQ